MFQSSPACVLAKLYTCLRGLRHVYESGLKFRALCALFESRLNNITFDATTLSLTVAFLQGEPECFSHGRPLPCWCDMDWPLLPLWPRDARDPRRHRPRRCRPWRLLHRRRRALQPAGGLSAPQSATASESVTLGAAAVEFEALRSLPTTLPVAGWISGAQVTVTVPGRRRAVLPGCGGDSSQASQLGPLARPGPEAAVEIVIAECSVILLWPF